MYRFRLADSLQHLLLRKLQQHIIQKSKPNNQNNNNDSMIEQTFHRSGFSLGRIIFAAGIVAALPVPTESQSESL